MLDLAGLGESPLVVRVRKRYRYFVVGVCRLGYSGGVEDSYFVMVCHKHLAVLIEAGIDYRVAVGLVVGMEHSGGRSWRPVGLAAKECRVGSAGRTPVWESGSWRRNSKGDLGRAGLAGRNCFETECIAQ